MKHSLFASILLLMALFTVCKQGSAQNNTRVKTADVPCFGAAFNSNKEVYRGSGYAESTDFSVARNKAYLLALQELSASIKTQLASVSTLYTRSENKPASFKQEFEGLIQESINETLDEVKTICQKQENLGKGKLKVYIALEVDKKELLKKIEGKSAAPTHAALDFQKTKFEDLFNKEMEKTN